MYDMSMLKKTHQSFHKEIHQEVASLELKSTFSQW